MAVESLALLWPAFVFAAICAAISVAFSVYTARQGVTSSQLEALKEREKDLTEKYTKQQDFLEGLSEQSALQWQRIKTQEVELTALRAENTALKKITREQDALIAALQRQLAGLARGDQQASKRLRSVLTKKMNEVDLRQWAFDLQIPFEDLPGETTPALVVSMLDYLERHGQLDQGLDELKKIRPDIGEL